MVSYEMGRGYILSGISLTHRLYISTAIPSQEMEPLPIAHFPHMIVPSSDTTLVYGAGRRTVVGVADVDCIFN